MKKTKTKLPVKLIAGFLLILLALSLIVGYILKTLVTSEYFSVKEVIIKEPTKADLSYLKGRNIFSVDLEGESAYIMQFCPECRRVRVTRLLPDKICVDFLKRRAMGLVKLYKLYAVDEYGVLFSAPAPEEGALSLPVITGLETRILGPKPGKRYNIKELQAALNIIRLAKENKVLRVFRIQRIDVANLNSISFFIPLFLKNADYSSPKLKGPFGFEVKISGDGLRDKMVILSGLMLQERNNLLNIKYIDLRFKEPTIRFKENNVKQ